MKCSVVKGANYFLNFLSFLALALTALALSDLDTFGFFAFTFFKTAGSSFLGENPGNTCRGMLLPI